MNALFHPKFCRSTDGKEFNITLMTTLSTEKRLVASTGERLLGAEILSVSTIYLLAVIVRYMTYVMMPYWSGDEYIYKSIAAGIWHFGRAGPLTSAMVGVPINFPNLLYPYLISPTFILGGNFYFGVRLINSIVINMAVFPCYLIGRKFLSRTWALIAASISISIPFMNIGAFAVTEVLFFPLFLLCIWVVVENFERPYSIAWPMAFGGLVAVLMNVRLNAVVLFPAYLISLLWVSLKRQQALNLVKRPNWLISLVFFGGIYLISQHLLGVRRIGGLGYYTVVVGGVKGILSTIFNHKVGIFHLIVGHLTTLAIPYALPIALIISTLVLNKDECRIDDGFYNFLVIVAVFSLFMIMLALIFTIDVSPVDLGGLGRWHSRYYFYVYPLIIIAGTIFLERMPTSRRYNSSVLVLPIVLLLLVADIYFIKLHGAVQNPWFGSIVDNMDVQWYRWASVFYWPFIVCTLVIAWLWYKRSDYLVQVLPFFLIVWILVANYGTWKVATKFGLGEMPDPCGVIGTEYLDAHPGRFAIVGDSRGSMVGAAFWNPFIPEKTILHSSDNPLNAAEIGVPVDYLIVNGRIRVDAPYHPLVSLGECVIYGQSFLFPGDIVPFFTKALFKSGWSDPENAFRWSDGKSAEISFIINKKDLSRFKGKFSLLAGSLGKERIGISLNGRKIYAGQLLPNQDTALNIVFNPLLLKVGENILRFNLPDAHKPENGDTRVLALAFKSFSFQ